MSPEERESKTKRKKLTADELKTGVIKTGEPNPKTPFGITEPKHNSFLYATLQAVCACEEIFVGLQHIRRNQWNHHNCKFMKKTVPINIELYRLYTSLGSAYWDFTRFELVRFRVAQSAEEYANLGEDKEHEPFIFFIAFVQSARQEFNGIKGKLKTSATTAEEAWNNLLESDDSLYAKLFYGIQESGTTGCECEASEEPKVFKHFLYLNLHLISKSTTKTVQNMLKHLEKEEPTKCKTCDRNSYKYTKIAIVPEILVIIMPLNIPIGFEAEPSVELNKEKLDLIATIQHKSEQQTVVYTALRKYEKQWFHCEPKSVRTADEASRRKIRDTTQLDLVFYRNRSSKLPSKWKSKFVEKSVPYFNKRVQTVRACEARLSDFSLITDRVYLQLHRNQDCMVVSAFSNQTTVESRSSDAKPLCVTNRPYGEKSQYPSAHRVHLKNILFMGGSGELEPYIYIEREVHWGRLHCFVDKDGYLSMTVAYYWELNPDDQLKGPVTKFLLTCSEAQYVNTVYPNRALTSGDPQLAIGLQMTSDGKTGHRISRREICEAVICELSVLELRAYRDLPKEIVGHHFAIYVGKRAKMAVIDPIDITDADSERTRTLLNEGSVFIGDCYLYYEFVTNFSVTFKKKRFRKLLSLEDQRYFDDIKNPVLFLAQNRAGFLLQFFTQNIVSSEYYALLFIPEEGSFETITDWDTGIAAIVNLVGVECLYKNTVSCDRFTALPVITDENEKQLKEWQKRPIVLRWMPGFKRYSDSAVNLLLTDSKTVLTLPPDPNSKYKSTQTFHESNDRWHY